MPRQPNRRTSPDKRRLQTSITPDNKEWLRAEAVRLDIPMSHLVEHIFQHTRSRMGDLLGRKNPIGAIQIKYADQLWAELPRTTVRDIKIQAEMHDVNLRFFLHTMFQYYRAKNRKPTLWAVNETSGIDA